MAVIYNGPEPKIKIRDSVFDSIVKFFSLTERKATVFLAAEKRDNCFYVDGWTIPYQDSSNYYNVIKRQDQLEILGTVPEDAKNLCYIGALRGGKEVKKEQDKSDYDFAKAIFNGLDGFFFINMDRSGAATGTAFMGNMQFTEITVERDCPDFDDKFIKGLQDEITKKLGSGASGSQEKRSVKIPSPLLKNDLPWRSVL